MSSLVVNEDELKHALKFMVKKSALIETDGIYSINAALDDEFVDHLRDLLTYSLIKYDAKYGSSNGETFLL